MEKGKQPAGVTRSFQNLNLNKSSNKPNTNTISNRYPNFSVLPFKKPKPPSLLNLCLAVIAEYLEDIIQDLGDTVSNFPSDIKKTIAALARRKKLLNDNIIVALADSSWDILDLSCSDVSDVGVLRVAETCKFLRAVDISRCGKISVLGVSELMQKCPSLEVLRCGGCCESDYTARRCLDLLRPKLDIGEKESWEDFDAQEIDGGVPSLRWLVWPNINQDSLEICSVECPRIILNPKPSSFRYMGTKIPTEAVSDIALDKKFVDGIDPKAWMATKSNPTSASDTGSGDTELSMAEKFRLAFVERDMKFAPKRAKNARQRERRAKLEWVMADSTAKAVFLASKASKSLNSLN